ncbi:MAG: putative bifunctional diguanylate cyclase/phosphodiesterase [Janthinobacterium lividum]
MSDEQSSVSVAHNAAAPTSGELLRLVVESATDFAIIATDARGGITVWNAGAQHLFGYPEREVIGRPIDMLFTPEDRATGVVAMEKRRAMTVGRAEDERWHLRRDGSRFWGSGLMMPLAAPGAGFTKIVRDRTAQKQAGDRLAHAEWELRTLVEGMPQLLWRSCDAGNWTWASLQWLAFTGQSQAESHGHGWIDAVHPRDRDATAAAWADARAHGMLDVEFRVRRASDGAYVWHRTRSMPLRDADGRIVEWLGTTTDIEDLKVLQGRQQVLLAEVGRRARDLEAEMEERKLIEAQLLYTAHHDDLTKLRNRAFFMNRVRRAMGRNEGTADLRCAVLFLDLDHFKLVNDSLGHQAGDLLLIEVAGRMQACMRPQDTLARVGGDEFAMLVEGFDEIGTVIALARQVIEAMRRPLWLGTQEVFSSCSIGVVEATAHHHLPDDLLRDADVAMFQAKRTGAGGYAIFTEAMRASAVQALQLQTDLRNAMARHEFHLHYQPICDAATGGVIGVEALLRWQHPQRGMVSPAEFIPVAEDTGLIQNIGRWVLREACAQMQAWRRSNPEVPLRLSVNASGKELLDLRFVQDVRDALATTGFYPQWLQIEVTESVFLQQAELVGEVLSRLRALGIRIALDDFGTGYSSLGYLSRYPMDVVKIDRSFVAEMLAQPRMRAIVETVIRLGQAMRLDVVAEGIETEAQLLALRAAGCGYVQGYLLGRPGPAEEFEVMLTRAEVVC